MQPERTDGRTMENTGPKITFGMIVLNGEPFVLYNLRALYPFAHQIIVVEGAAPSAKGIATPDGHSRDRTLETLRRFQKDEDPERKLVVVTAEDEGKPDGFWTEKDEMSQAYARRATGNYLWQIDCDEFYLPREMELVIGMLRKDPGIKAVTFRVLTFWGGLEFLSDSLYLQKGAHDFHRLFAWGPGYRYSIHRPPTVLDERGRDLRKIKWVSGAQTARMGIRMYHYELLFPKQVEEKCEYYKTSNPLGVFSALDGWMRDSFFSLAKPYRVHMMYQHSSWLERFSGDQPPQAKAMVEAVRGGKHQGITTRGTEDIDVLLADRGYAAGRIALGGLASIYRFKASVSRQRRKTKEKIRELLKSPKSGKSAVPISTNYEPVRGDTARSSFENAWKDPSIASSQRKLVDSELARMRKGEVVPPFRALADAIRRTGCEAGRMIEVGCASGYYREVLRHTSWARRSDTSESTIPWLCSPRAAGITPERRSSPGMPRSFPCGTAHARCSSRDASYFTSRNTGRRSPRLRARLVTGSFSTGRR
ncbi:MAG: Glycosyltransferase family 2 protein [Actinobacteria bacterium]|nr:Glycosyltransferase family 2 protein [Actinomycetota bacterium]